ncbi:MFS transporter [Lactobacillaceae bacterium 24-114]
MNRQGVELKWLLLGMFLGSIGNSFVWPLTTIYMHDQLHESLTVSGIVLLLYSGANVVGSYISGMLFDKREPRRLMLGGTITATLVMGLLIIFNGWPTYGILLTVVGFMNGWIITLVNSYGTQSGKDGRYVFNMLYFANNLGMVIGTTIVGPLYQYANGNVSPMFTITTILYVLFSTVVFFFFHDSKDRTSNRQTQTDDEDKAIQMPISNLIISWTFFITLTVIWTMYEQWSSNLSVFMTGQGISMTKYSLLWTINGILIVLIQLIITWINHYRTNLYLQVYIGIFTVGLSFVLLLFAKSYLWFVMAMIVLTIGEATAFPTMPAIVNELSPAAIKGKYQGILNAFSSIGKAIGPLFGGIMIELTSYQGLFIICAASVFVMLLIVIGIVQVNKMRTTNY